MERGQYFVVAAKRDVKQIEKKFSLPLKNLSRC